MTVGHKIRQLRRQRGLSQEALALELGTVHPRAVSNWEIGKHEPSFRAVRALCRYFGISLNEFLKGVDD